MLKGKGKGKVVAFPHPPGVGGPGSFQKRFEESLIRHGWKVIYSDSAIVPDVILVVGGTKRLIWLIKMKLAKVPIVYRLDGINWLHKRFRFGIGQFLLGELRNINSRIIHAFLSDRIIYQSEFVKEWWESYGLRNRRDYSIILNGVDLAVFKPHRKHACNRLICVEGTIDYTPYAIRLLNEIASIGKLEVHVYGGFIDPSSKFKLTDKIKYHGKIELSAVPGILKDGIFLSLDINPACPNTIIEALASGLPVLSFNTGALSEIVTECCGRVVPYGSDPWKLSYPDVSGMINFLDEIIANFDSLSTNARDYAAAHFDINLVFKKYERIFVELIELKG